MNVDELLQRKGLKFEDLDAEEQETLNSWLGALNRGQINMGVVRDYVAKMREAVSQQLADVEETPTTWLSLLCFLIPLIGIIRKWYMDQKRLMLTARLRNYILLEALLESPEKAKRAIERQIENMQVKGR